MIFRPVSSLVFASLTAFAVSPINSQQRLKKQHSMLSRKGCSSTQEMELGGEELGDDISVLPSLSLFNEEDMLDEIEHSKNLVKKTEMKRTSLEKKVLELYSLKEKLSSIACLQRNLADKSCEIDKLDSAIFALRGEIKDLKEIVRKGTLEEKQLEMTKKMLKEMQIKNGNTSHVKGQILVLEEKLSGFNADETATEEDLVKNKVEAVKDIELQVLQTRRMNKELELEKREILVKLYTAHAKVSALSDVKEPNYKTIAKINELKHANRNLSDEVERLQKSKLDMVEEVVYQRWLSACLRAEIKEHQASSRKTLQKASDRKPSEIITSYPDTNSTSSYTSSTDSEDIDSSSTIGSFSSSQRSISQGPSVVSSPNKSSIGSPSEQTGIIRRFSTSMLPSKTSMLSTELDGTSSKENVLVTKVRRVSFNDVVETVSLAAEKREFPSSEVSPVEPNWLSDSNRRSVNKDDRDVQEVSCRENAQPQGNLHSSITDAIHNENKIESTEDSRLFAFLLFVFVLILCFVHLSAKIY